MIVLQVKDLTKSYGTDTIFENISFVMQEGEKAGLVGPNGAGKSTLFRCITGVEEADSGNVMFNDRRSLGYLEQLPSFPKGTTLFDAILEMFADVLSLRGEMRRLEFAMSDSAQDLEKVMEQYSSVTEEYERQGGFSCEAVARKVVIGLGFKESDLTREINTFSGGEKTRASLARLLIKEPDILLLDEPTNHLDLQAVEWLENFLQDYGGAVLVISHDRYFLDKVTTKTFELSFKSLDQFAGNYSRYLILREEKSIAEQRAYEKQQREIEKTEEYINKYRAGIKSKQARGRETRLGRLERLSAPKTNQAIKLNVGMKTTESGNLVVQATDVSFSYENKTILKDVNVQLEKGEKIALIGGNGAGKSTFLKILVSEIQPLSGEVRYGSRVNVGYYDQEHSGLNKSKRVIDELMYEFGMSEAEARDYLAAFLFREDDVFKTVNSLSGGERGRLAFLKLLLRNPNFLILDEPTNHLDIASKEVIEDFLQTFEGTVLMVSHDRYFIDKVVNRTLELENAEIISYLGNYSYYREKKAGQKQLLETQKTIASKVTNKNSLEEKPKVNKAKTRERISKLEEEISLMEDRHKEIGELLADPSVYQDENIAKKLLLEYKDLEQKIPEAYQEWENLNELIEQ